MRSIPSSGTSVARSGEGFLESQLEGLFALAYEDSPAPAIRPDTRALTLEASPSKDVALEGVWLFETFMRALMETINHGGVDSSLPTDCYLANFPRRVACRDSISRVVPVHPLAASTKVLGYT